MNEVFLRFEIAAAAVTAAFAVSGLASARAASPAPKLEIEVGNPVIVSLSRAGEKRWGFHQFPSLARIPDGRIVATYSHNEDAVEAYGAACPAFVSADGGKTWTRMEKADFLGMKPHPSVCEAAPGEFLCVPPARPFDLNPGKLEMPEPVVSGKGNGALSLHRFEESPKEVRDYVRNIDAFRWTPAAKEWKPEKITYDTKDLLIWKRARGKWATGSEAHLVPRTWFEHPPVRFGNELIYADYRTKYLGKDGATSARWSSTCMASADRGKTWKRVGTIAAGTDERPMCEPMIAPTSDGRLACAIRTAPGPLVMTCSADAGRTWEPVKPLNKFGVFPGLILLENNVLVVSYGRPGVQLRFSPDGTGNTWTEPTALIPAKGKWNELSCGYTSLLAVGRNEFLIAYSDFEYKNEKGTQCKAILVRRIRAAIRES